MSAVALSGLLVSGAAAQGTRSARAPQVQATAASEIDASLAALRAAMELERRGDMAGADRALRAILDRDPQSLSALIALERILAVEGRTDQLLPYVDRLIEQDEDSPIGHQMRVRANSMLDRIEGIERAAEAWIRASPAIETPYREVARIWQQRGDYQRALDGCSVAARRCVAMTRSPSSWAICMRRSATASVRSRNGSARSPRTDRASCWCSDGWRGCRMAARPWCAS
jgi:tetratricopeptide (TPR) repeat protein